MMWDLKQVARDARIVNGTPEGERFIGYLLDFCHVFDPSFNESDARFRHNEGQRSVGAQIVSLLVNPEDVFKAQTLRVIATQMKGTTRE